MPKQSISYSEYTVLIGLMGLAKRHRDSLEELERLAVGIVGDDMAVALAMETGLSAAALLRRLGVSVTERQR